MTEQDVRAIVRDILEERLRSKGLVPPEIGDATRLADLGVVDSMEFLALVTEVERRTGREPDFSEADPDDFASFGGLVKVLSA